MKRILAVLLTLVLTVSLVSISKAESIMDIDIGLTISFIDVGRGDAILLRCGGESMLIDGGSRSKGNTVKNYLDSIGLTELTYMLNTHRHNDHIDGLIWLVENNFSVGEYLSPYRENFLDPDGRHDKMVRWLRQRNIVYHQIGNGDEMWLGNLVHLEFLRDESKGGTPNSYSVVTKVTFGETTILLMADVEGEAQRHLLKEYGSDFFKADILKCSHHGTTAMVYEFLDAVDPDLAIVTNSRKKNSGIENQLNNRKIKHYYTAEGTVEIQSDGLDWTVMK